MKARIQYWFILWVVVFASVLYALQQAQPAPYPVTLLDHLRLILVSAWVVPLPMAVIGLWGLLRYRSINPPALLRQQVVFRIVTRGDNRAAVLATVSNIKQTLASLNPMPLDWWIEVVTDKSLGISEELVVPDDYQTPNGAKWKARALHYALEVSRASMNTWIFHLDEESQIDAGTVYGIAEFTTNNPGTIGQGAILYNRELRSNTWLTMADSLRTGDDIGRFHAQYQQQNCLFGMHGSFILLPNFIEQAIGFDYAPAQCVTEDAYFGLKALEGRYKFGWVNGFVYEQSPRTVRDFLKQRRRWYLGICQVILSDLKWSTKGVLTLSTLAWTGSVLVMFATLVNFAAPIRIPEWVRIGGDLSLAIYAALYWVGLHMNLRGTKTSVCRRALMYVALIISIPVYSAMEVAGVVYGIIRPELGFEVIDK